MSDTITTPTAPAARPESPVLVASWPEFVGLAVVTATLLLISGWVIIPS